MSETYYNNLNEESERENTLEVIIGGILTVTLGALFFVILWLW
jgi:hypothetical protein